jgi:putative transposase
LNRFGEIAVLGVGYILPPASQPNSQRNYYEHVISDEPDLDRIRAYIETNPMRWREDSFFVE